MTPDSRMAHTAKRTTSTPEWYRNMVRPVFRPRPAESNTEPTISYSDTKVLDVEIDISQSLMNLDPNARPKHFKNAFEEYIFIFTVMMSTAATTFLQGGILINTASIGKDLQMNSAQVTWISAAIGLASGSFMLFFGKTADLFGRKLQLLLGMTSLCVFSLFTAFAPNPIIMNMLCGLLGLGTAVISPPAIGTLFITYPEGRRRNKATGALGAGNPIGFILGSISSGLATKYWNWRASFLVISTFFFIVTGLSIWTMPAFPRIGNTRMQARQFDYLGTVLTIMGMALLLAGLTQGPEIGWKSPTVLTILIVGVFCLISFGFWECYFTHPLLNPTVWRNKTFTLCVLCTMFGYMSFITNQFWISLYMQEVQGLEPLHIALRFLPQAFAGIAWSYIGQNLADKVNGTVLMGIGGISYIVGSILLYFIQENTSYWKLLFPSLIITVIGADFQFIIANLYITKQMPRQSSLAAGVLQTAMRICIAFGLGITTAAFGSVDKTRAHKDVNLPYSRAYMCGIIFASIGLIFIPFMKIQPQGVKSQNRTTTISFHPRNGGEFIDDVGGEIGVNAHEQASGSDSSTSNWTGVAEGSYFPRWSWEYDRWTGSRGHEYRGADVIYEICVKCLEERKVQVGSSSDTLVNSDSMSDGIHGVWNSPRHSGLNQTLRSDQQRAWSGGQWNHQVDDGYYAERGIRNGGDGWL